MLSFDALTFEKWINEQKEIITQSRIQKIQQPSRREIILNLRKNGISRKLYINIDSIFFHICFLTEKTEKLRAITQPKTPPMFCMLLRKYLEGCKIIDINFVSGERIFEIITEKTDEFSTPVRLRLAIELMGKYSNIILYNETDKTIFGAAHNVGDEKSRTRQISGGLPYIYPETQKKKFIETTVFQDFLNLIKFAHKKPHFVAAENYFYLTIFSSYKIAEKTIKNYAEKNIFTETELRKYYEEIVEHTTNNNLTPCINEKENYYWLFDDKKSEFTTNNVNEMIDIYYANNYAQKLFESTQKNLLTKLNKDKQKHQKIIQNITQKNKDKLQAEEYKKSADLIMANLYSNEFKTEKVELVDYETNKKITVKIDINKTPTENANKFYKLYAKAKKATEISAKIVAENQEKKAILEDYIFSVNSAENFEELLEIKNEILHENIIKKGQKKDKNNQTIVPSVEINGFSVYTGRNNRQNDIIYSKISTSQDLWFHVLNNSGAHILIKVPKNKNVDNDTLLKVAQLAKKMSNAKNSGKTSVVYTKRQYIKRPPNTQAGYVTFKNETEIVVE